MKKTYLVFMVTKTPSGDDYSYEFVTDSAPKGRQLDWWLKLNANYCTEEECFETIVEHVITELTNLPEPITLPTQDPKPNMEMQF